MKLQQVSSRAAAQSRQILAAAMPKLFLSRAGSLSWLRAVLTIAAQVGLYAACVNAQPPATANSRPNILLALSDDQSYPHASILGDSVVKTPAFDRVARDGVLFTHCFAACPSCTASRSALLTGRPMWQLGEGGVLFGTLERRFPLVTHLLQDAGYHVGYVGKPWAPGDWRAGGLPRHPNGMEYANKLERDPPEGINVLDYAANFANFLADRPSGAPFMFWYGCTEPHREYQQGIGLRSGKRLEDVQVPPFLPDTPEVRQELLDYYFEIEHFDKHLGRMLEILERDGELDNTLVVVTSDNGMPFSRSKATLYDSGVRMPLAMCWGKSAPPGRTVDDFIGHVDLAPTFLEAAGIPIPDTMTGKSLLPLLVSSSEGRIDPRRDRIVTAIERHTYCRPDGATYPIRALRNYQFLYVRNFEPERWPTGGPVFLSSNKAVHGDIDDGPFKEYMLLETTRSAFPEIFERGFGKRPLEELYQLDSDPHQLRNLAFDPNYEQVKEQMWQELQKHLQDTDDPRMHGADPWQTMIYRQVEGFGATYNLSLPQEERAAAQSREKHEVSPGAKR